MIYIYLKQLNQNISHKVSFEIERYSHFMPSRLTEDSLELNIRKRNKDLTSTDPISDTREPLGIGGGFGVDEKPRLFTSITEGSECVVSIPASATLPIPFSPFPHFCFCLSLRIRLIDEKKKNLERKLVSEFGGLQTLMEKKKGRERRRLYGRRCERERGVLVIRARERQ